MTKSHQNLHKYFPEFNLEHLKHYAKSWASKYPNIQIERIILYRYDTQHQERFRQRHNSKWPTTKYAVVFEFSNCNEVSIRSIDSYPNVEDDECIRFIKETKFAGQYGGIHTFIDDAFPLRVYREQAKEKFHREWGFVPKKSDEELTGNILTDQPYWMLFQRKSAIVKRLRPCQRHKINCRKVADNFWKEDPEMTIAAISKTQEIFKACGGKHYKEKTIRNWIKELCPNHSPGRRPKKR